MQTSSTLQFQRSFDGFRSVHQPLALFRDPASLLDWLHSKTNEPDAKNLILSALIEAAQGEGYASDCALTMLLLALWPGLDAIRRRSIWRRIGTADEVASDVLARTTEAVRRLDLARVNWIAVTVLRNVERDMVRARQHDAARENLNSDTEPDDAVTDQVRQRPEAEDAFIQKDLQTLIGGDALLVVRVAIEGFTQSEAALELGLSEDAAHKRYQRAIRRLRDALQQIV